MPAHQFVCKGVVHNQLAPAAVDAFDDTLASTADAFSPSRVLGLASGCLEEIWMYSVSHAYPAWIVFGVTRDEETGVVRGDGPGGMQHHDEIRAVRKDQRRYRVCRCGW